MTRSAAFLSIAAAVMFMGFGMASPGHAASMPVAAAQCLAANAGMATEVRCRRVCRWRCWGPWWNRRCGNRCYRRCW
jgi:hypothetical protein